MMLPSSEGRFPAADSIKEAPPNPTFTGDGARGADRLRDMDTGLAFGEAEMDQTGQRCMDTFSQ